MSATSVKTCSLLSVAFLLGFLTAFFLFATSSSKNSNNSNILISGGGRSASNSARFLLLPNDSATATTRSSNVIVASDTFLMPVSHAVRRDRIHSPLSASVNPFSFVASIASSDLDIGEPDYPRNPRVYCELALLHAGHCTADESAPHCIRRVSAVTLQRVLPIRCSNSTWFRRFVAEEEEQQQQQQQRSNESSKMISSGGKIPDSLAMPPAPVVSLSGNTAQIFHKRHYAQVPQCEWIHRLPNSVPEEMIVDKVERNKLFDFNPLIPPKFGVGVKIEYGFGRHDEAILAELYSRSYFAWDHRRGGWSSQRHLEILAAGCVPFFVDLDLYCNDTRVCLPGYPVDLVRQLMALPGVQHLRFDRASSKTRRRFFSTRTYIGSPRINFKRPGEIRWNEFDEDKYFKLADQLLNFTKNHLTTKAMASYWLKIMGNERPKGYVFVTAPYFMWESLGLIHGLAALGIKVLVVNNRNILHKLRVNATEVEKAAARSIFWKGHRGAGYTFGFRTNANNIFDCAPPEAATTSEALDCLKLIKSGQVDLFSYSAAGAATVDKYYYYKEYVRDNISPERVAFVDGNDGANTFMRPEFADVCKRGHKMFAREAPYPWDGVQPMAEL